MRPEDRTPSSGAEQLALGVVPVGADAVVVTVEGEVDLHTATDLIDTLESVWQRPGLATVVIDLAGVTFLGSSGLGVLADLAGRPASRAPGGRGPVVRLVAPAGNDAVVRPWTTMNLQQVLPLHPDTETALRHA